MNTQSSLFGIEIKDMPKKDYDDMTPVMKSDVDLRKDMTGQKAVIEIERRSNGEHLVYCNSLGFGGEHSKDSEGKEQEEIKGFRNALIVRGVKEEDISIHEHFYQYTEDKPEFIEKKIKELSAELKKYLEKKFGYPVIIRILKESDKNV